VVDVKDRASGARDQVPVDGLVAAVLGTVREPVCED
jgi:hypothetical protein